MRSKSKAYALFESSLIDSIEVGTIKGLQQEIKVIQTGYCFAVGC